MDRVIIDILEKEALNQCKEPNTNGLNRSDRLFIEEEAAVREWTAFNLLNQCMDHPKGSALDIFDEFLFTVEEIHAQAPSTRSKRWSKAVIEYTNELMRKFL